MPDTTGMWKITKRSSGLVFSLDEAKRWLKVEPSITDDDDVILSVMKSAQAYIEKKTNILLSQAEVQEVFTEFDSELMLSVFPVNSITSVTYMDTDGNWQTLASTDYTLTEGFPQRVVEALNKTWPNTAQMPEVAKVLYLAGYDDPEKVSEELKMAFRSILAEWYENRENPIRERESLADRILNTIPYQWP